MLTSQMELIVRSLGVAWEEPVRSGSDMTSLPIWMRRALLSTAVMNLFAAAAFLPSASAVRALAELPDDVHPLYLATIGMFILIFGIGYLWTGATGRADRLFIALAACGKITFFTILVGFWLAGELSLRPPLLGAADLFFGVLFLIWLAGSRPTLAAGLSAAGGNGRRLASGA